MAYFPNGTSGMDYTETYCSKCANWKDNGSGSEGCFIFDLHLLWNYEAANGEESPKDSAKHAKWDALEHFIPTSKDGIGADKCRMFHPLDPQDQVIDKKEALREWEAIYGKRAE